MPAEISLWKHEWFYAIAEHRFVFNEIDNIEAYLVMLFCVVYFEVEPLVVPFRVYVILKYQIVRLYLWWLFSIRVKQIARFEMGVKPNCIWRHGQYFFIHLKHSIWKLRAKDNVNPIDGHEHISKIIFPPVGPKSGIGRCEVAISIPQSRTALPIFLVILLQHIFNFLFHALMLEHRILQLS